jgi:hypothetical protein
MATEDRFWRKVDIAPNGCWLWSGFVDKGGYARLRDDAGKHGEVLYAHRFAYELLVGPIPDGRQIDHLCRVRRCVNPQHLEAVTQRENILRGQAPSAIAFRRGTCRKGHPYDVITASGSRRCRRCDRENERRRRQERRAVA